jgi:hypothetical protein
VLANSVQVSPSFANTRFEFFRPKFRVEALRLRLNDFSSKRRVTAD